MVYSHSGSNTTSYESQRKILDLNPVWSFLISDFGVLIIFVLKNDRNWSENETTQHGDFTWWKAWEDCGKMPKGRIRPIWRKVAPVLLGIVQAFIFGLRARCSDTRNRSNPYDPNIPPRSHQMCPKYSCQFHWFARCASSHRLDKDDLLPRHQPLLQSLPPSLVILTLAVSGF